MNWPLCSYSTRGVAHKGHRYCKAHIRMRVPPLIPGWLSGSIIIWLWWYQHRSNAWWRYSCFAGYYVLSFAYLSIVMEQGKTRAMTTALYMDLVLKSWFQCDPPSCSFFLRISLMKQLWNWEMKQMPTSVEESMEVSWYFQWWSEGTSSYRPIDESQSNYDITLWSLNDWYLLSHGYILFDTIVIFYSSLKLKVSTAIHRDLWGGGGWNSKLHPVWEWYSRKHSHSLHIIYNVAVDFWSMLVYIYNLFILADSEVEYHI